MSGQDCLFCRIVDGEIPADVIHESDSAIAFRDINPQAPTHVLIIPRRHISTINNLNAGDEELVGSLYLRRACRQLVSGGERNCAARRLNGRRLSCGHELWRGCRAVGIPHTSAFVGWSIVELAAGIKKTRSRS